MLVVTAMGGNSDGEEAEDADADDNCVVDGRCDD